MTERRKYKYPEPGPDDIGAVRKGAGLTQSEAASLVYVTLRAWQWWEAGKRRMPLAVWELFQIKAHLHVKAQRLKKLRTEMEERKKKSGSHDWETSHLAESSYLAALQGSLKADEREQAPQPPEPPKPKTRLSYLRAKGARRGHSRKKESGKASA